jgi:hypothetical protein
VEPTTLMAAQQVQPMADPSTLGRAPLPRNVLPATSSFAPVLAKIAPPCGDLWGGEEAGGGGAGAAGAQGEQWMCGCNCCGGLRRARASRSRGGAG